LILKQVERQLLQYMDMTHHTLGVIFESDEIRRHYWENAPALSRNAGITRVRGFGDRGRTQATNLWFDDHPVVLGEEAPAFPQPLEQGFITWAHMTENGPQDWRILYRHDARLGVWMAVGTDLDHASAIGTSTLVRATLPLLVILPLTVAIVLWGARRGLRPLDQLARKIEARETYALDPIDMTGIPLEIRPLVQSLNALLARLRRALESESRFTANAAHELQTPLAAVQAEVQRYQRQSDPDSEEMLAGISTRVRRATNTVTQLLTLARLDPEQMVQLEAVELNELIVDAVAEEGGKALERKLDVRMPEPAPVTIHGHAEWLKILLRNLVANAFRYADHGGVVEIALDPQPGKVLLTIANDCPVIDDDNWRRLTDRFFTLPGSEAGGVGLGLSIVQRIAEQHDAVLRLGSWQSGRGFLVELEFPSAPSALRIAGNDPPPGAC
jgi:signal transduction histidine kinase